MVPQDIHIFLIGQMRGQHSLIGLSQFFRTMLLHLLSLQKQINLQQFHIMESFLLLHNEVLTEIRANRVQFVLLFAVETTEQLRRVSHAQQSRHIEFSHVHHGDLSRYVEIFTLGGMGLHMPDIGTFTERNFDRGGRGEQLLIAASPHQLSLTAQFRWHLPLPDLSFNLFIQSRNLDPLQLALSQCALSLGAHLRLVQSDEQFGGPTGLGAEQS